jgi:hypothetical protein
MTCLSNYSPDIVPGGDTSKHCSLLMETTYSLQPPSARGLRDTVVEGLVMKGS